MGTPYQIAALVMGQNGYVGQVVLSEASKVGIVNTVLNAIHQMISFWG